MLNGPNWNGVETTAGLWDADLVLHSGPSKSAALNCALNKLRGARVPVVVRDDDDRFGPDGLVEFAKLLEHHRIVAQPRNWVWDGRNLWLLSGHKSDVGRPGDSLFWGGNFGFMSHLACEFPDQRNEQCQQWARDMGADVWFKPRHGACLDRTQPDHLWEASMEMVRRCSEGSALRFDGLDWELINGERDLSDGVVVPQPSMKTAHEAEFMRMTAGGQA